MDLNQEITDLRGLVQRLTQENDDLKFEISRLQSQLGIMEDRESLRDDEAIIPIFPALKPEI